MRITDVMGSKGTYHHGETNQDIMMNIYMREEKDLHWQVYPGNVKLHDVKQRHGGGRRESQKWKK